MTCPLCDSSAVENGLLTADGTQLRCCLTCSLVFHTDIRNAEALHGFYAGYYDSANLRFNDLTESSYALLLTTLAAYRTSGRILDVGCGAGQFLTAARAAGWEPYGVEIAAGVREALQKWGLDIFHGELSAAAFPKAHFDVVYCAEVIEHVLDPADLLREMGRVLRPGGLLYLTTPNYNSLSRRLLGAKWRVLCREHISYFTERVLAGVVVRSGFESPRMVTRNIDPHECAKLFRPGRAPEAGFQADAVDVWRRRTTSGPAMRLLKRAVNGILAWTTSGDTIIVRATKPVPPDARAASR